MSTARRRTSDRYAVPVVVLTSVIEYAGRRSRVLEADHARHEPGRIARQYVIWNKLHMMCNTWAQSCL
jgi:hypothetical protein